MTSKCTAQTNQERNSEKPQGSGILQRAAVHSVSNAGVQSTEDKEAQLLSNSALSKDFSRVPLSTTKPQQIMAKLMIGAVGDKYEQEADRVAAQVVQRINAPASVQSGEDETVQQKEMETKDNAARLMRSPILQRKFSDAGMAATPDLEASINRARGGGQPMADNIRQPMEKVFGADFSGVKVHTDAQADQLNRSIQARAFTTGQNVFFRQGEYNLGSREGQELIAHELTHVVQQNGRAMQRSPQAAERLKDDPTIETPWLLAHEFVHTVQQGAAPIQAQVMTKKAPAAQVTTGAMIMIQKNVDPTTFFTGARPDTNVNADINTDKMSGFGTKVNSQDWHTQLTFDPIVTPGAVGGHVMHPEGSGVTGVIGPDHPYGSQPNSMTAMQNNRIAGDIRGMNPHGHVAAHILNDQLGGPGIDQNLFALPGNANTLMETQVENKMKRAVAAGNYIYYRAIVHHPLVGGPADYITMSWNKLDEDGNNIRGGQDNVRINANNTSAHSADAGQASGVEAKNQNLINPTDAYEIKKTPWGPFQMPDPKQKNVLGNYLDFSEFPAIGNKKAFEEFFKDSKKDLSTMFLALPDTAKLTNIATWIDNKESKIPIRSQEGGRGVTRNMLNQLKTGTTQEKQDAFAAILKESDAANKMIPMAAQQFAKEARSTARNRV